MKQWFYVVNSSNSSTGFGHLELSGEFVIKKNFGIGFATIYSPFSRTNKNVFREYDENGYTETTEEIKFIENKLRLLAKVYIHFNIKNPKWDIDISGGLGANILFRNA